MGNFKKFLKYWATCNHKQTGQSLIYHRILINAVNKYIDFVVVRDCLRDLRYIRFRKNKHMYGPCAKQNLPISTFIKYRHYVDSTCNIKAPVMGPLLILHLPERIVPNSFIPGSTRINCLRNKKLVENSFKLGLLN